MDAKALELMEIARNTILNSKNDVDRLNKINTAMSNMYKYIATLPQEIVRDFDNQVAIFEIECLLKDEFLPINSKPLFDPSIDEKLPSNILTKEDVTKALDYIVHEIRKNFSKFVDIENSNLEKYCIDISSNIKYMCDELGIENRLYELNEDLSKGLFHCFNMLSFSLSSGEKINYIVDCSYRQFFTLSDSNLDRIPIMIDEAKGCSMGTYMIMDEQRKKIAEEILTKGYIEANEDSIKAYFDGYIFKSRDGEFYKNNNLDYHNKVDCIPNYSAFDYLEAINGNGLKQIDIKDENKKI